MIARRFVVVVPVVFAGALVLMGLANAPSPGPLKVVRRLTFDVTFDAKSTIENHISGFERGTLADVTGSGPRTPTNGYGSSGTELSGTSTSAGPVTRREGVITVDVVAATGDGGLAVDVSETDGSHRPTNPVRVGITDESLYYSADADLTDEERALLHYLARDLVKPTTIDAGTTWVDDVRASGSVERMRYTVNGVDDQTKLLDATIDGTNAQRGMSGFTSTTTGSMTYDLATLVPTKLNLDTRTTTEHGDRVIRIESSLSATLRDDSFAKRS